MPKLGEEPFVHEDCEITDSRFGRSVEIGKGSRITSVSLDDYFYCDRFADIANAEIGKFENIANYARTGPTHHPMHRASQHHFLYRSPDFWGDAGIDAEFFVHRRWRIARIGHDTWIGHGAVIRPEVTVGHSAVVAAGALVTKDVAPYAIVAWLPAAPMRARFPAAIVDWLLALAWWDWSHAVLRERLDDFRSVEIEAFLEKYEQTPP